MVVLFKESLQMSWGVLSYHSLDPPRKARVEATSSLETVRVVIVHFEYKFLLLN